MKIALVLENFDPQAGGLEQWTVRFAEFLLGRGHEVYVVAFQQANHSPLVRMTLLPPTRGLMRRAAMVAHALPELAVDVVYDAGLSWSGDVHHPQTGSRLLSQARLIATHSLLHRLRAAVSPFSIRWRMQVARLERRQIRSARKIIAVSGLVRAHLCARHGLAPDHVTMIWNGVDTARFAADRLDGLREGARVELGAGNVTLFLASAFNMRLKGVDTAIRALALLVAEGAVARLLVAGALPDASWHRLVSDLRAGDHVTFLGPVADMVPIFAACDVLVHATRWDACSLSTIEGQAAGMPVITTAMNGAAELIIDGETGFVLEDPEDVGALASRMRSLLDPALRHRIGESARRAAAAFEVRNNQAAVERLLIEAAKERRQTDQRPR
jgi:glycosyltransferase involved in cell wall biosynthesis